MPRAASPDSTDDSLPRLRRLALLSLAGVALSLLLVAGLAFAALQLETAVRSYVKGESLWSKGQKESVIALQSYARSGDPTDWEDYRHALRVPLGDRRARLALEEDPPDLRAARDGFRQGGLGPEEIDGMIRLYRWFGDWGPVRRSIRRWAQGDSLIADLRAQARRVRAEWRDPPPDSAVVARAMARVDTLNDVLALRERQFTAAVDEAADTVRRWSLGGIGGLSLLLLAASGGLIWRNLGLLRQREEAIRRSEARYRRLFEQTLVGVIRTDPEPGGRVLDCNEALADMLGYPGPDEIIGRPVSDFYPDGEATRRETLHPLMEEGDLVRFDLEVEAADGSTLWLLGHSRLVEDPEEGRVIEGLYFDITEQKRMEAELRHRALHDPLTGLANRALLTDRVEQGLARAGRNGEPLGLLMLDVDHFKRINDRLGHAAGDRVLTALGRRLREAVRADDTVARWGGDEFAVVLPEISDPDALADVRDRVQEAVRAPVDAGGEPVHVDVTVGGVVHAEDAGDPRTVETADAEELLRFGSLALHRAKEDAPAGFTLFSPDDEVEGAAQIRRERQLREAVDAEDIVPHYQPVVRLSDVSMVDLEVLARWRHPDRGAVPPDEFIPLAEELGLIGRLEASVLRRACEQVAKWEASGAAEAPLPIGVNVSPRQFGAADVAERLERCVREAGCRPDQVTLEVTETSLMRAPSRVEVLREAGFRVSADDFGTGYSTFSYLRELELDELKIDTTFVQGITDNAADAALVETMVSLGRRLGLQVIAEGIETEAQRRTLQELGCDLGQGYLFGRPVPADELEARWLGETGDR